MHRGLPWFNSLRSGMASRTKPSGVAGGSGILALGTPTGGASYDYSGNASGVVTGVDSVDPLRLASEASIVVASDKSPGNTSDVSQGEGTGANVPKCMSCGR